MKQISSWFALFSCAALAGLLLGSCTKKDKVLNPQSVSNTFSTVVEKAPTPPVPPADPAIAYVVTGTVPKLMVMNADGSNQTVIQTGTSIGQPSWSPDAHSIVFTGTIGGQNGILIVDVSVVNGIPTGSNLRPIPINNVTNKPSWARWSPLGDLIVFRATSSEYDRNIYTIPPTGGTATIVYTSPTGISPTHPDWSPDASKLVFCEATNGAPYQKNLLVLELETSQVTTVLPFSDFYLKRWPAWSRNGDRIAYSGTSGNNAEAIYTVTPVANATPVKVINGVFPTWSPDDSKFAFNGSKPAGIYSYTFSSGTRQKLSDGTWANWRR